MSKSKARSKALLIAFLDLIPDMDKVVNKKLLDSLNVYSGHDNDLIVIMNEDGPTIIELNSLKSVSMLAQKLSVFLLIIMWKCSKFLSIQLTLRKLTHFSKKHLQFQCLKL